MRIFLSGFRLSLLLVDDCPEITAFGDLITEFFCGCSRCGFCAIAFSVCWVCSFARNDLLDAVAAALSVSDDFDCVKHVGVLSGFRLSLGSLSLCLNINTV